MPRPLLAPVPEPIFGEPVHTPDPTHFHTKHPSDNKEYKKIEGLLTKDVVSFPTSRAAADALYPLADAYGAEGAKVVHRIEKAGHIVFHAFGDSGASSARNYKNEIRVSDQVTTDFHKASVANRPAFLFHLGDVIYNFGEARYYYDQFYEPFRDYAAPIFAIAGNHDSFILPDTSAGQTPLDTFTRNFCSPSPVVTAEAGSLHRTAATQPGIYFTLDAPFVRIIGLFSNSLEDPGVLSSNNGQWPHVPDIQLAFLTAQLEKIKAEKYTGAVLLAVHHPPFVYAPPPTEGGAGGTHGSSLDMLAQIDTICKATGVYPHAILSGHSHNYQRFTRTFPFAGATYQVPFVVCGSGGHHVNPIVQANFGSIPPEPAKGQDVHYLDIDPIIQATALVLEQYDGQDYGYLRVTVDSKSLQIGFHPVKSTVASDLVTVDLGGRTIS